MSCKSAIYTANTTPSTLTTVATQTVFTLPLGRTVRRFGQDLFQDGDGVQVGNNCCSNSSGYYSAQGNVTLVPVAAGDYTVGIYVNGTLVPGSQQTVTAVANASIAFNPLALIRVSCCGEGTDITLGVTTTVAAPATIGVTNVGLEVKKD